MFTVFLIWKKWAVGSKQIWQLNYVKMAAPEKNHATEIVYMYLLQKKVFCSINVFKMKVSENLFQLKKENFLPNFVYHCTL